MSVATGFAPVGAAFLGLMGLAAALGAAAVLAISGFAFLVAGVTFGCLGAFVTGLGVGLGEVGNWP